ncbi:xanthine dehydrogenase family protein molybdopterin-binding subunit [Roseomonas sp. NAR14]|uniref:Xanthine dehydrogenase family protein molybdopterin-binding subunit n=1 Tax=Roseomonas acroporae TaxID=2937791 RepID=A0A9X1YB95_9PROT|nr:xanthine dehydrogenase family protein molybdopterin-binding subunit [Roseomonas acroporae]MCK8785492.1 xanthine dehydrogenase family protein molybdopterin-binding subunit [Roseomonas acroporae]
MGHIGTPTSRVDGRAKVTGTARYAAEYVAPDLAYGVVVSSPVARGKIRAIDASAALAVPGVVQVFTHENRPSLAWFSRSWQDEVAPPGSPFRPLYDKEIHYSGQPVALVVAEEFEAARHAATLLRIEYETLPHATDLGAAREEAYEPRKKRSGIPPPAKPRGDAQAGYEAGAVKLEAEYRHGFEHHNPMEMHAATVVWEGDGRITVYDKTQGSQNCQSYIHNVFGIPSDQVRVVNAYVGGAFGSGLRPHYQLFLAVMAATQLERSVRVVLTRQQMFTFTHRPDTIQKMALAADADGKLTAFRHEAVQNTSRFEDYQEAVVNWAGLLYKCDNTLFDYRLAQLDLPTPGDMRAPGAATGLIGIECAMDELAYAAKLDPLEFRLRNYSEIDQDNNRKYTSKALREAYHIGAERFGWGRRSMAPGSMREGGELIGWGMATGVWEAMMMKTAANAVLHADGRVEVACATSDIGTGTYTILAQIAAEALGVDLARVTVRIGDSDLPKSPVSGGSWTAASAGAAVDAACQALRKSLFKLARGMDDSPLANASLDRVVFDGGAIRLADDEARAVALTDVLTAHHLSLVEEEGAASPSMISSMRYSRYTHSAVFAEVRVDAQLKVVRVTRIVNAVAAGRILNPKTARSQILGGVVMGMGMALYEETMPDHRFGRFMNHNLAEYHVAAHADVQGIDVIFVDEPDEEVSPLGVKGLGEIGIVGTPAAIANAIFHATGKRVRELPITIDKLLD